MKPWKIVVIVLVGFLALGGSIGLFVYRLTQPPADAGTAFLRQIATAGSDAAYATTSQAFQADVPKARLAELAQRFGLTQFDDASWTSRNIEGSIAHISGTVTLKSGATLPMEMTLVKENGTWLVTGFKVLGGVPPGGGGDNRSKT